MIKGLKNYFLSLNLVEIIRKKRRDYNNRPEVREHKRIWRKSYIKQYYKRPYVDRKRKKYFKEYYNRPAIKAKQKKYYKKYYIGNKEKYVEASVRAQKKKLASKKDLNEYQ